MKLSELTDIPDNQFGRLMILASRLDDEQLGKLLVLTSTEYKNPVIDFKRRNDRGDFDMLTEEEVENFKRGIMPKENREPLTDEQFQIRKQAAKKLHENIWRGKATATAIDIIYELTGGFDTESFEILARAFYTYMEMRGKQYQTLLREYYTRQTPEYQAGQDMTVQLDNLTKIIVANPDPDPNINPDNDPTLQRGTPEYIMDAYKHGTPINGLAMLYAVTDGLDPVRIMELTELWTKYDEETEDAIKDARRENIEQILVEQNTGDNQPE